MSSNDGKTCVLCGHTIAFERCGTARADGEPLCHADDHSCYHRWTVYGDRPGNREEDNHV